MDDQSLTLFLLRFRLVFSDWYDKKLAEETSRKNSMVHYPTFEQFVELSKRSKLVTICRRLANDALTPVSAFLCLEQIHGGGNSFLLESVIGGENISRYSFVGSKPFLQFEAFGDKAR